MNQFNQDLNSTLQTSTFQGTDNVCCWFGGWNWFKNWLEICFSMAFVTYILVVGYVLGMQDRFSPEVYYEVIVWMILKFENFMGQIRIHPWKVLATTASSALTALILEIIIIWVTMFASCNSPPWETLWIGDHNCDVHQHHSCQMGLPGLLHVQVGFVKSKLLFLLNWLIS